LNLKVKKNTKTIFRNINKIKNTFINKIISNQIKSQFQNLLNLLNQKILLKALEFHQLIAMSISYLHYQLTQLYSLILKYHKQILDDVPQISKELTIVFCHQSTQFHLQLHTSLNALQ